MKTINKFLVVAALTLGAQTVKADPVSELTAIATAQIAEQAAAMKTHLAEQLQQSLTESLSDVMSDDHETAETEVIAGLASNDAKVVE